MRIWTAAYQIDIIAIQAKAELAVKIVKKVINIKKTEQDGSN